jgi:uncharacterized protein
MAGKRVRSRFLVRGMTCSACETRIDRAVSAVPGVRRVAASAALGEVTVEHDPGMVDFSPVRDAISSVGYAVVDAVPAAASASPPGRAGVLRFIGLLAMVGAAFLLFSTVGRGLLPSVSQSMGFGLIFVVGLLTSLHCVAMCGGIVLSQAVGPRHGTRILPGLLYNAGRVISYTVIGGAVGALGSVLSLSTSLKGAMPVVAGAFMLFLGVRMLGVFPALSRLKVRIPVPGGARLRAAARGRGPLVIGLLNGLMPCGPLQTMQVYALGTGSFAAGALSMFLFSLGTVPLMLGLGALSTLLSAKFNRRMVMASGVLVAALGLVMAARGASLFGVAIPGMGTRGAPTVAAAATGGVQVVRSTVDAGAYYPITVTSGVPVRWIITVKAGELTSCNSPLTVPSYGIRKVLSVGENVVEFTPGTPGTIAYTCWMGMISSTITVLAAPSPMAAAFEEAGAPSAAAAAAPLVDIGFATQDARGQTAVVTVGAAGYSPSVIVLKKGVKARIRFVAAQLTGCNSVVVFPEYNGRLDLAGGQLETPWIDVTDDFTFQCGMAMLHGSVKVVDDPGRVDRAALRREVSAATPRSSGMSCSCCP